MQVILHSITPHEQEDNAYILEVQINNDRHVFQIDIDYNRIGTQDMRVIHGSRDFYRVLQLDNTLISPILKAVAHVYDGIKIDLPMTMQSSLPHHDNL
ncbi:MAG: hypothetical protein AAGF95_35530 [Chloroflexota bacterium]